MDGGYYLWLVQRSVLVNEKGGTSTKVKSGIYKWFDKSVKFKKYILSTI